MVILTSPPVQILVILTSPPFQILVILTSATGPILLIDFFSQPNSGHIDVFWTTTITRISDSEAVLKLKKASAEFFTPFSLLRGSRSMIYQFFSDYGRVPLKKEHFSSSKIDKIRAQFQFQLASLAELRFALYLVFYIYYMGIVFMLRPGLV